MIELLRQLADSAQFIPHGMCLLWRPDLLALHGLSDLFIALAYFTIPVFIIRATRARPDLIDRRVAQLFAAFITACALSHLSALVTLWLPIYGIQGTIKALTAGVSIFTAYRLAQLVPTFLELPSHADLVHRDAELMLKTRDLADSRLIQEKLSDFAYIASHDLRAPIRGIANQVRFLEEDHGADLPRAARKRLTRIGDLCARIDGLIASLLQYSRLSAPGAREPVSVDHAVGQIRETLAELLDEKNAEIFVDTPLPQIMASPADLDTVLRNLIVNGVTYNTSERREIHIGFLGRYESRGQVLRNVVYVRDNGIGIAPEFHEHVFAMFRRLQDENAFGSGSGAGLAFVKRIVTNAGGGIALDSSPGDGSTFYISLEPTEDDRAHDPDPLLHPAPA